MHGKSIAWVRDRCRLENAYRPLLYAVATHADRHYATCTASATTLGRSSGMSSRWVKKLLPELVEMGVLERLDVGAGRRPASYRIAPPLWVEGEVSGSAVVEGEASATDVVEGAASGHTMWPLELSTGTASGEVSSPQAPRSGELHDPVVVNSVFRSGEVPWPLTSGNASQDKNLEDKNLEDKNVRDSRSLASARSNPDAMEPPPVPESVKRELHRRGLGPRQHPKRPGVAQRPPRTREQQLAELQRKFADDFKGGQEQEPPAGHAVALAGTIEVKAAVAAAAVRVMGQSAGQVVDDVQEAAG